MRQVSKLNRLFIPFFVMTLGLILAVSVFYTIRYLEYQDLKAKFTLDGQNRINAISREIDINIEVIQSLRSLYISSEKVTREEFRKFTNSQIKNHPGIQALEWIPRITDSKRYAFVKAAQNEFYPNFQITQMGLQGKMETASKREEYFPVYFLEPYIGNEKAMGFDLASNPLRLEAMEKSRNSGEIVATERITLVQEKKDLSSFLLFLPIYKKHQVLETVEDRTANIVGFVLGVFNIGNIVDHALTYLDPVGIDINIYDESTYSDNQFLYLHLSRANNRIKDNENENSFIFDQIINVADRKWRIIAKPTSVYFALVKDWHASSASIGVMIMALLIALYLKNNADLVSKLSNEITERKKAKEMLSKSEEGLIEAQTIAHVGSWDWDVIKNEESWSQETYQIFGVNPKNFTPNYESFMNAIHPDDRGFVSKAVEAGLEKDNSIDIDYRIRRPDGTERIVNSRGKVFRDKKGNPIRMAGTVQDITDRKKVEQEREHLNIALNQKNKELEQIVYITSHDLRTPLVNIGGYSKEITKSLEEVVSILRTAEDLTVAEEKVALIVESDIAESEQYISKNLFKMENLLSGLLNLSRLGRQELKKEKLNMDNLMADIAKSMTYQIRDIGAKLELCELPFCTGDIIQINQLFSNLIGNALKYLDSERSGVIKISGYKENDHSVYCVEDNGIGIAPEHQEIIFEIFYQLNPSKVEGEGLGLSIATKIVNRHSGKMWVESEVDKGSKFFVSIPS